ncbi:hypothetical protein DL95DRAFT_516951 [Leptodontidium sp. 2 PMI_412]|nr:hypothetical protein DL95DRAFT_516951 [Leptodontidium sp. 2 PMI_412]
MSFLRKRSGSQCSFTNGDDEITVRRVEQTDVSRKSRSDTIQSARSSCSSVEASDFAIHDSCVTDEYITEDERKTCPLLWCRDVFETQEAMLQHVWNCPHLVKGLYWCFHCQKPERVGKFNCKRCQGAPSRTDRMTSVAKRIFSKLGAKPHRSDHTGASSSSESSKGLSKLSEESDSSVPPYFQDPFQQDQSTSWGYPDAQELPNSAVVPEMAGDWTAASHELPDTYISEMAGTECPIELGGGIETWEDNFYAENFEEWDVPALPSPKGRGSSPKLEIDTSVAHTLQPTQWIDTPLSATIISPMSAFGKFESSSNSSPVEISPTDSDVSGRSFFTDSGYSSATTQSATFSARSFDRFPSIGEKKGKKREFGTVSESWIKDTASSIPQSLSSVAAMPILTPSVETSQVVHSAGRCTGSSKLKITSPHWHDAQSLVLSFSESLDAHIQHTKSALQNLPQTPTTVELSSMSRTSIASIGLEVLTGILEGRHPSAIVQIFAFTHVACALAIATDDDEAKIHTQKWFQDSLQWSAGLRGERQQKGYEKVARAVWQPLETLAVLEPTHYLQEFKDNSLFTTCKHFLDIFESLDSPKANASIAIQQFNFAQASFEHRAKTRVIDELIKKPRIEAFIEDVVNVERRLHQGQISSVRELELKLISAGKFASQSDSAYSRFLQHVATLCDVMYAEEPAKMCRTRYHVRDISRIKQLMPDENYDEETGHDEREQTSLLRDLHDDDDENLLLLDLDFESTPRGTSAIDHRHDVEVFSRDCDKMLRFTHSSHTSVHVQSHRTYSQNTPAAREDQHQQFSQPPSILLNPPTPTPTQILTSSSASVSVSPSPASTTPSSQSAHRCHCGYIPTGEERWKASNLRRHKRIQHAAESKVYICRWRGCKSSFTRSDNLKCHVKEKGHYEGAEGSSGEDGEGRRKRRRVEGRE